MRPFSPTIQDFRPDPAGEQRRDDGDLHEQSPFGAAEISRWLELFDETVDAYFEGPVAEEAKDRARQVAFVLRAALTRPLELRIVS